MEWTDWIAVIAGFVAILSFIRDTLKEGKGIWWESTRRILRSRFLSLIGIILALAAIGFAIIPRIIPNAAEVDIILPVNGSTVPREILVEGTSSGISDDSSIWICIMPSNMRYYPQLAPATISPDGKWHSTAFIGQEPPEDSGESFVILVVVADDDANNEFLNYVQTSENTKEWPGMSSLPIGANILGQTVVKRQGIDIQIILPVDGSTIPREILVDGTFSGIPDEFNIWICVIPPNMRYYPQPSPATKSTDGKWHSAVYVGQEPPADSGKSFIIMVVVTNDDANSEFLDYVYNSERAEEWLGIPSLPTGAYQCYEIRVIRE